MTASMTNRSGRGEISISLPVATIGGPGKATLMTSCGSILARLMASNDDSASAECLPNALPARPSRLTLLSICSFANATSIRSFCFSRASFICALYAANAGCLTSAPARTVNSLMQMHHDCSQCLIDCSDLHCWSSGALHRGWRPRSHRRNNQWSDCWTSFTERWEIVDDGM